MTSQAKLTQRIVESNSLVCVGLDSEVTKLPKKFASEKFPQFAFNQAIIDATHEFVSVYKPNMAFYEARGEQGVHELKMTIEYLQATYPDIWTICDAKRADIGSTNEGYMKSIFDWYGFDAVTLQPYLGQEALQPFLQREDKVSIILCRTSNPGAGEFQDLQVQAGGGSSLQPLWAKVATAVATTWNANHNCMLVVGATYPDEMQKIRELTGDLAFLVPGIGAQGGDLEKTMRAGLNTQKAGLLINSGRAIIFSSDGDDFAARAGQEAQKLRDEINTYR
jgi:orotidine-5'-phosphate decarboxylase